MNKFAKIKLELAKLIASLGSIKTETAELFYAEDELAIGNGLYVESEGEYIPATDGDYMLDGKTYKVKDGVLVEIVEKEEVVAEEPKDDVVEIVEKILAKIAELETKINGIEASKEEMKDKLTATEDKVNKICQMSAVESVENEIEKEDNNSRFKDILAGIKNAN